MYNILKFYSFSVYSVKNFFSIILALLCLHHPAVLPRILAYSKWPTCSVTVKDKCDLDNVHHIDSSRFIFHEKNSLAASNYTKMEIKSGVINYIPSNLFDVFNNLEKLSMYSCQLMKLKRGDFKKANHLESAILYTNHLKELGDFTFAGADHLMVIDLSKNELSTITDRAFWNLRKLEELSLQNNKISRLHPNTLANNKKLAKLHLEQNILRNLEFIQGSDKLEHLTLSHNRIQYIDPKLFVNKNKLKSLSLSGNCLTNFELNYKLKVLDYLGLADNYLTSFSNEQLPKLLTLTFLNNNFNCSQLNAIISVYGGHTLLDISKSCKNESSGAVEVQHKRDNCETQPDDFLLVNTLFNVDPSLICLGTIC